MLPSIGAFARRPACAPRSDPRAIIRRTADATLAISLRLRWSWRVDELPSELPEDTLLTHDSLSVALEFDDARARFRRVELVDGDRVLRLL